MRNRLLILGILFAAAGCRGTGTPDLLNPGTASEQLRKSQRYDVYPEPETGPTVDGSRPPGMDKPWPETARSRWHNPMRP